jgi:hypothetical protein
VPILSLSLHFFLAGYRADRALRRMFRPAPQAAGETYSY